MTTEEAIKITKVNKDSEFRIVPVEDLGIWETTLNTILANPNANINIPENVREELDQLSHDIMSVRL